MKKNSLKKNAVLTLFATLVAFSVTAQTYSEADNIKSKRQLEYPSLEQKGKFTRGCVYITSANCRYYWKKKGLLKGPDDPYSDIYTDVMVSSVEANIRRAVAPNMWLMRAPSLDYLPHGKKPPAELLLSRLADWMALDDNAALAMSFDCPMGHVVAVDTIIKEKNRYLILISSWGEKYTIELPRPVRWSNDASIAGKVVGGNPKSARGLYSLVTGGEKGPNCVGISFSDFPLTLLPAEEVKETYKYMLDCASKGEQIDMKKLHPFFGLSFFHTDLLM